MSFMMQIEAAQKPPIDMLAADYYVILSMKSDPSIDFCCRVLGVPDSDESIARRLDVPVAKVRGWRDIGRRASSRWTCR